MSGRKEKKGGAPQALLPARRVHDVAVIGGSLAAVAAAALLARHGRKVLLVDTEGRAAHVVRGGFRVRDALPLVPAPRAIPALQGILEECGVAADVGRALSPLPLLGLVEPGLRALLPREQEARRREWQRELGDEAGGRQEERLEQAAARGDATLTALAGRSVPPIGPWQRFLHGRFGGAQAALRAEVGGDGAADRLVEALVRLFGLHDGPPSALSAGRIAGPLLAAPHLLPGGVDALIEALRGTIEAHGSDVAGRPGAPATLLGLRTSWGAFAALSLEGGASDYEARAAIVSLPSGELAQALPEGRARRRLEADAATLAPRQLRATTSFVLRQAGLPPGWPALAIARVDGAPVALAIEPALDAAGAAVAGHLLVTASIVAAADEARAGSSLASALAALLPWHERHVVEATRAPSPSLRPLASARAGAPLGVEALAPEGPLRRLLRAGVEQLPGLGIEGELLAATACVRSVEGWVKRVDRLG